MKKLSVFQKHQLRIAKYTLRMSDAGASVMGGMTKDEARAFLRRLGWSEKRIAELEA
jgi:hypothetical protein